MEQFRTISNSVEQKGILKKKNEKKNQRTKTTFEFFDLKKVLFYFTLENMTRFKENCFLDFFVFEKKCFS